MASSLFIVPFTTTPNCNSVPCSKTHRIDNHSTFNFRVSSRPTCPFKGRRLRFATTNQRSHSDSNSLPSDEEEEEEEEGLVEDLRVPEHWVDPSKALEESEWLRVTLHKWLDDEYCPEETNVDISNVAAHSYYESLVEKQTDLGEILLNMARELESISYQESFHGAFSSANAAINLIIHRIEQD